MDMDIWGDLTPLLPLLIAVGLALGELANQRRPRWERTRLSWFVSVILSVMGVIGAMIVAFLLSEL